MLIEHLTKRKGGTYIPFGPMAKPDIVYHFKPADGNHDSPHVCEVTNPDHIARFLSLPEGYKAAEPEQKKAEPGPKTPDYRKMTAEQLIHEFRMKFGRSPSGLMKVDNIIAKLEE